MTHIPVLLKEVIEILNPQPGEFFIDGTVGSGGHALEIIQRLKPGGKFLGIDWDDEAIKSFNAEILSKAEGLKPILVNDDFANLAEILKEKRLGRADGLLLDLGLSSRHLEKSGHGFSFLKNEFLDMRFNKDTELTAYKIVNEYSQEKLAEIFWKYGEEKYSRKIAKRIIEERRKKNIRTTFDLVEIIKKAVPPYYHHRHGHRRSLHPATRTFQALRIFINKELENLEKLLLLLSKKEILKSKGRIAIISFHSLEDRLVKTSFKKMAKEGEATLLTKKPIRPSQEEIERNPRSRSAKLRALQLTTNL